MKPIPVLQGPPFRFYTPRKWLLFRFITGVAFPLVCLITLIVSVFGNWNAGGYFTVSAATALLLAGAVLLVGALVWSFLRSWRTPLITVDERGWSSTFSGRDMCFEWADIGSVEVHGKGGGAYVGVVLKNPTAVISRMPNRLRKTALEQQSATGMIGLVGCVFLPVSSDDFIKFVGPYASEMVAKNSGLAGGDFIEYPRSARL